MTSTYEEIQGKFLKRITDYGLSGYTERLAEQLINEYMFEVLADPKFRKLLTDLKYDDDMEEIEYSLRNSIDEITDKLYVEKVISTGMIPAWLEHRHYNSLHLDQFFGNNEQKWYSQAPHVQAVQAVYTKAQRDYNKLIRDWGYDTSVINGVTT